MKSVSTFTLFARGLSAFAIVVLFVDCVPPTSLSLHHTGRLAEPSRSGDIRVGATSDVSDIVNPELGYRLRLAERLEIDLSGYTALVLNHEGPEVGASMGRVGLGIGLIQHEKGAFSLLTGLAAGAVAVPIAESNSSVWEPVIGADIGAAGSWRPIPWFETYVGFRFALTTAIDRSSGQTYFWLQPALGIRLTPHPVFSISLEWANAFYTNTYGNDFLTGASIAFIFRVPRKNRETQNEENQSFYHVQKASGGHTLDQ